MKFYLYFIFGFLGGIPAGMGMGGGTITIPILTIFGGVPQKVAQSANLFAFMPMGVLALREHNKNGLIQKKGIFFIVVVAFLSSAIGGIVAFFLPTRVLRRGFGIFLIALSFFSFRKEYKSN